jgi:hypothetical protein
MTDAAAPILSPSFEQARSLSRLLSTAFAIFFYMTLFYLAVVGLLMFLRHGSIGWEDAALVPLDGHAIGARILGAFSLMVGVLPGLFMLHHARRLFGLFAQGEVFTAGAIAHVRAAGIWLVVSACAAGVAKIGLAIANGDPVQLTQHLVHLDSLAFGIATVIAAHVMAEAQRIADENASIL